MQALKLPARRGLRWLTDGYALFRKNRLMLSLAVLGYWSLMALINSFPFVGQLATTLLIPVFSVSLMNVCLYAAIDRIGLGLAVTLEFLGPLTVALLGSRRRIDLACALLAAAGVVVMTRPGPTTDLLGVALGLTAAARA